MAIDDVSDLSRRVRYTSGAGQTAFTYPFRIFEEADLKVYVDDVLQTLGVAYNVTGVDNDTGGSVVFLAGLSAGQIVTIYSDTELNRDTDYQQNGPWGSARLNSEFDKLMVIAQELRAKLARAIRGSVLGNTVAEMPSAADRASKYLYFNASGDPTVVTGDPSQPITHRVYVRYPLTGDTVIPVPADYTPGSYDLSVYLNGLKLVRDDDYAETSTNSITLVVPATTGDVIEFDIGTVFDVTLAKTARTQQFLTGVTGTTLTLTTISYTPGGNEIDVFMNGSRLAPADYTETNSTTITLASPAISTDEFMVVVGRVTDVLTASRSQIGAALYPITASEIAASVSPTDYGYAPGDVRRYGFNGDAGTTDNTVAFQAALNGNAGFCPVIVPNMGAYAKLTGRITAPANTHIILQNGAELRWTTTAAAGSDFLSAATRPGIEVTGNNFTLEGHGLLRGPTSAAYVSNECAILMLGTSTSVRKSGLTVRGAIEITDWGSYGVLTQFVDDVNISDPETHIHDVGYCGVCAASSDHGRVTKIQVGSITPGTGGEAYAVSLSSDTRNYSTDPNAGTKQAAHPFCSDWVVDECTIYDVPIWRGLDAHGAYETHFINNKIFNCGLPIGLSASSGDAAAYAGWDNSVTGNVIDARKRDGTATTTTAQRGAIIINGGTTVRHKRVSCKGNKIYGYGLTTNAWENISASYVEDATITENQLDNWEGNGIYTTGGSGIIANNTFGPVSTISNSKCIRIDGTDTGVWTVTGNRHRVLTGNVAAEGIRVTANTPRILYANNDFSSATSPETFGGEACFGASDLTPLVNVVDADITSNAFSIAACGRAPRVRVYVALAGAQTVADITGAFVGQIITIHCNDGNLTFNRTNAALAGGANFTSSQYDVLELLCIATSGTKFIETGRVANS